MCPYTYSENKTNSRWTIQYKYGQKHDKVACDSVRGGNFALVFIVLQ